MDTAKIEVIQAIAPVISIVGVSAMIGWVAMTWLRIKNGYPLDGAWGQAVYPKSDGKDEARVRTLGEVSAALRTELSAIKGRLASLETIITEGYGLTHQIEALRVPHRQRETL